MMQRLRDDQVLNDHLRQPEEEVKIRLLEEIMRLEFLLLLLDHPLSVEKSISQELVSFTLL